MYKKRGLHETNEHNHEEYLKFAGICEESLPFQTKKKKNRFSGFH